MNGAALCALFARAAKHAAAQLVVIVWSAMFGSEPPSPGQRRILMKSPRAYRNFFVRIDDERHIRPIAESYQQKMLKDLWKSCIERAQVVDAARISLLTSFRGSAHRSMMGIVVVPPRLPGLRRTSRTVRP
jgi:hypothetical protein